MNRPERTPWERRLFRWKIYLVVLAAMACGLLVWFRNYFFNGNFGVVAREAVFRSAQPEKDLRRLVETYHVASILNLRGGTAEDPFYANEVRLARDKDIDFFDLPLSATRRPSRRELLILIDLFERCRYPLLIHCKSGSDRTGLASGLYLMSRAGERPERALQEFSYYHGHVPLLGTETLHEPFLEYGEWLKSRQLAHTPGRLRSWVEQEYRSNDRGIDAPRLQAGPRAQLRAAAARRGLRGG